jgi:hypothetical protein
VTFQPDAVLSGLKAELPAATPELFLVEGGKGGIVQYTVTVTSARGGQLLVVVGPDGKIVSVDPN